VVYLVHLDQPYKHAKHYMDYTEDLEKRLAEHRSGRGSRLMAVIKEAGITWRLARVRTGKRAEERRLKAQHNSPRLCPYCNPAAAGAPSRCPDWEEIQEIPY
jgi:predicted GIY-YIG superfamily endonuclease